MSTFLGRVKRSIFRRLYFRIGIHMKSSVSSKRAMQFRYWTGSRFVEYCGKNVNFEHGAKFNPQLSIGDNSGVGMNCELSGRIVIGNDVMMGPNCIMRTYSHRHDRIDIPMTKQGFEPEQVMYIGDDVWIGANTVILRGTVIGRDCVVGAGSVLKGVYPAGSVIVQKRTENIYEKGRVSG